MQIVLKILITSLVVVAVSEIAKRGSIFAGVLASLPLTSTLAFVWLWIDTGDSARIAALSRDIFWLVLPSMLFFQVLPALLGAGVSFWGSLALSAAATALAYAGVVWALARFATG
jgi:uncharacterized membrane protein (GlpM family)